MPLRKVVYERAGRASELAQLLEYEIGTALLALDGIQTGSYLAPNADEYTRLRAELESKTLGQSLRRLKDQLSLQTDIEAELTEALRVRNHLAHHFFRQHGLAMLEEDGQKKMIQELDECIAALHTAYTSAGHVAHSIVAKLHELRAISNGSA
ncbi:MAG: hypothetical protein KF892_23705 [Rhizobacter sp.]|nr:hypothetical protein [Rhizobacter sp.]